MKAIKVIASVVTLIFIIGLLGKSCSEPSITTNQPSVNTQAQVNDNVAKPQEENKPDIEILQKKAKWNPDVQGVVTIYCVCRNNSDELKDYVEIDASFFDKNGGILGTGMGNTTNFPAHSERTIEVTAMDINSTCDHYKVDVKDGL